MVAFGTSTRNVQTAISLNHDYLTGNRSLKEQFKETGGIVNCLNNPDGKH